MSAALHLEIVTPDKQVFSDTVDYVGAPGVEGEFGILANHIPFLSALSVGGLYYKQQGKTEYIFVSGGFLEVSDNKVTVLAEAAETVKSIDIARAIKAKERALERLDKKDFEKVNVFRAEASLRRAISRLALTSGQK